MRRRWRRWRRRWRRADSEANIARGNEGA